MKKTLAILLIVLIFTTMLPVTQLQAVAKTAASYLAEGNKLLGQSKFQDSIKAFDAAIKLNSKYVEAYVGKGRALHGLKNYVEAIKMFDKAISLNKKYSQAYYFKGLSLFELDKHTDAITAYDSAILYNPKYVEAYNQKGYVLYWIGKYEEAFKSFDKAIALNPKFAEAYNNKGLCLELTDKYEEALAAYNTAIKLDSKCIDAYINKAALLLNQYEKNNDANTAVDAALKLNPNHEDALYLKAEILQAQNNHAAAIIYLDKAIKVNPNISSYYYKKGSSQYTLEKYADAVDSFSKAIDIFPKEFGQNPNHYLYRGLAYKGLGKYDLAMNDLKKAIELNPYNVDVFAGIFEDNQYYNDFLDMELSIPTEWSMSGIDLQKIIDELTGSDNIELPEAYIPFIAYKFPLESDVDFNSALMLNLENVSAYPQFKAGSDYLPALLEAMSKQRTYEYDPNMEKVTIDSIDFDVLHCRTEEGGIMVYQDLYATLYRGFVICFTLTFTTEAELTELEDILATVKFN